MKKIEIFTDGSSLGNPGAGGWCAIIRYKKHEKECFGGAGVATNNQMELQAAIEGIKALKEPCDVTLYSDSSYVTKGINDWLEGWVRRGFNKVKNPELWREYLEASKPHRIRAVWVKGHNGHPENERCDTIARNIAEQYQKGEQ